MTTPVVGSGDWQRYAQWRSSQIFGGTNVPVPFAGGLHYNWNSSSFAGLYVLGVNRGTSGLTFAMQTEDVIGGNLIDIESWILQPGQQFHAVVPLAGEIGAFNVTTANSGGGSCNLVLKLVNFVQGRPTQPTPGGGTRWTSQVVPISGSITLTPISTGDGPITLYYAPADASGKLSLEVQEPLENGTSNGSIFFDPAMPAVTNQPTIRNLDVSNVGPLIVVRNADAAATHTFSASYYQRNV
jgi:hypothetical protein